MHKYDSRSFFSIHSQLTSRWQIGTGAAAFMAIRVLLDHGVPQDHIIFVTFLVARCGGISMLQRAFPDVKIVCSAVDDHLREMWLECEEGEDEQPAEGRKVWVVEPGMGHIGSFRPYLLSSDVAHRLLQGIGTIYEWRLGSRYRLS